MRVFLSSRRRHTRCSRDWSSDVCSSDLPCWMAAVARQLGAGNRRAAIQQGIDGLGLAAGDGAGSEERGVGKEGRSRGGPDHLKKKKNSSVVQFEYGALCRMATVEVSLTL